MIPAQPLLQIDPARAGPFAGLLLRLARPALEGLLAFDTLNATYERVRAAGDEVSFERRVLDALAIHYDCEAAAEAIDRIPRHGPLVVIANHPYGGVEGLILADLLERIRPDFRLLANYLLARIPDLRPRLFLVDPFGGPAAAARNRGAMRAALQWVRDGGSLGIFPAGEVSHATWRRPRVTDPPWSDSLARFVRRSGATVVPVFFDGCNGRLFQLAGLIHPRLRTVLLPRELVNRRNRRLKVRVGHPVEPRRMGAIDTPAALTGYLRLRTYLLRSRADDDAAASHWRARRGLAKSPEPVAGGPPAAAVAGEIEALPGGQCLVRSGDHRVLWARAGQIPAALREVGRLRELTFREAGEGTGRAIDIDRFDSHYLHLLLWNAAERRILGAYRMGPTDDLLPRFGMGGLYTSTLFRYRPRLLRRIGPALELGRSFVLPECQRQYAPLMLLWKGIGRFVCAHPRYRMLFGPVSISDEYQSLTRQLLVCLLRAHNYDADLARLVRPRNPPRLPRLRDCDEQALAACVQGLEEADDLVREIEADRREIPVLLRQYLRLNARLLGFNVDPDFGDVLDGLVLVDLTRVDRAILARYMGAAGMAGFLAFHGAADPPGGAPPAQSEARSAGRSR